MATEVSIVGRPFRITATTTIPNSPSILGVVCAASSSGTITIADSPNGTLTTELAATTLVAGTFLPLYMRCTGNTTITVGGTLDATLILAPN